MKFTKAHVNGNDFVIIGGRSENCDVNLSLIADRNYGIGCDQIIFVSKEEGASYRIEFFNQDGSQAAMCGNGACAVAVYVRDILHDQRVELLLKISGAVYRTTVNNDEATVFFKNPVIDSPQIMDMIFVSTGNKHLIYNIPALESVSEAHAFSLQEKYPDRNIHFISRLSDSSISIKSFERGVGWTKACGSGAIAAVFALDFLPSSSCSSSCDPGFCCVSPINCSGSVVSTESRFTTERPRIKVVQDGGVSTVCRFEDEMSLTTRPKLIFNATLL